MTDTCGCCEGLEVLTPQSTANRPGLSHLKYRMGTHAAFVETMKARLSGHHFDGGNSPLNALRTRDSSDPTIALLDAWAMVADVLTFYQERIANEGYLRTATERRSVLELGRLVGYTLRPGVAATVYPAFMMEPGYDQDSEVPKGSRVQSIPTPGEMPQFFETSERIEARTAWNELKPRMSQPQAIKISPNQDAQKSTVNVEALYFQGTATNLKANDILLFDDGGNQLVRHIKAVEPDMIANRTKVVLQEAPTPTPEDQARDLNRALRKEGPKFIFDEDKKPCAFDRLRNSIEPLTRAPSLQPANRQRLDRVPQQTFKCQSDMPASLLGALKPNVSKTLYQAWANVPVTPSAQVKVYAMRTKASPFGHNAPLISSLVDIPISLTNPTRVSTAREVRYREWTINEPMNVPPPPPSPPAPLGPGPIP